MRALRIPNTSHFHNITNIKDALALWDSIKGKKVRHAACCCSCATLVAGERGVQSEQRRGVRGCARCVLCAAQYASILAGNVFNKKTYEDLKREGLI